MAKILRIIETLTDAKRLQWHMDVKKAIEKGLTPPKEPKEWGLELAYEAIVELLYHTYGESTVRNSIACLVERGYLKRYQAGNNTIPVYYINISIVQAALKKLAEDSLVDVENNTHIKKHRRVLKTTPKRPNSTPKGPNSTPTGVENNSQASEFNTNNIYSNNTDNTEKEKEDISADADSARDFSSSQQENQVTDASKEIAPTDHSAVVSASVDTPTDAPPSKPKRKPPKPRDINEPTAERIEAVYCYFDELAREVMDDPGFKYRRTRAAAECIVSLLKSRRVTQEELHQVYQSCWNTPIDEKTGFDWQKNMTIKAICNNFERVFIQLKSKKQNGRTGATNGAASSQPKMPPTMPTREQLLMEVY